MRNWTDAELDTLRRSWNSMSIKEIGKLLHRDKARVKRKAIEIGLGDRPTQKVWTKEMDEKAISAFHDGLFYRQIGELIGVTHFAVKKRLSRLGYKHDKAAVKEQTSRNGSRSQRMRREAIGRELSAPKPQPEPETRSWTDGVSFFELHHHHCRWIILGHGVNARFCGECKIEGQSYCANHYDRSIRHDQHKAVKELNVIAKRVYERGHYK